MSDFPVNAQADEDRRVRGRGAARARRLAPQQRCGRSTSLGRWPCRLAQGRRGLSEKQSLATRHATTRGGRMAVIGGVAGSDKCKAARELGRAGARTRP